MRVGVVGMGFVGGALYSSFYAKGQDISGFDKYKSIGKFEDILYSDIVFLCLPTLYVENHGYDLTSINETCIKLSKNDYKGLVVVKSTVEPETCKKLSAELGLFICHNPEFLTERTALEDFNNQSHIVMGFTNNVPQRMRDSLANLYEGLYPDARHSFCSSVESETMKLFCNNFYAIKVGIANEFSSLCSELSIDYNLVTEMMVGNKWISPNHLSVPGPDGRYGWGGNCFLKDTEALLKYMKEKNSPSEILEAAIKENKKIRDNNSPK